MAGQTADDGDVSSSSFTGIRHWLAGWLYIHIVPVLSGMAAFAAWPVNKQKSWHGIAQRE